MIPFNEDAVLEVHTAKQDKLEVNLGEWIVEGEEPVSTAMPSLLNGLTGLRVQLDNNPEDLRWFRARQRDQGQYIDFMGGGFGGHVEEGVPLISGRLSGRRYPGGGGTDGRFILYANLSINPTRFARYHAVRISPAVFAEERPPEDVTLLQSRRTNPTYPAIRELSLDGNDNVLLTQRSQWVSNADHWIRLVHYYWGNIIGFLDRSIEAAGGVGDVRIHRSSDWNINLQKAETYWEFWSEDAISALTAILPTLRTFGSNNRVDTYPNVAEERRSNCPSVRIHLINGISMKFYAKTNKRIRIEFTHDLTNNSRVLGGGHTSDNPGQLYHWLNSCATDAVDRGNQILRQIRTHEWTRTAQRPLYSFLARIVEACEDEVQYDLVLSLLSNNGVVHLRNNDPLGDLIRGLARRDVLQRTNLRAQTFSVHSQYRNALEQLQNGQS